MDSSHRVAEVSGYIKKVETLVSIENNVMPNTCVLESLNPFPGYHGKNMPDEEEPRSLFLLITNDYTFEDVARITKNLHTRFSRDFYASIGSIYMKPYSYSCIRIKHLSSFRYIRDLQHLLSQEGVRFSRYKDIERKALIVIQKNFLVEEQEDGIYKDLTTATRNYFEIPEKLSWERFKTFTFNIKNNLIDNNFDAALGVFYRLKGLSDVIRVYDWDTSLDKMRTLKDYYTEEVRKSHI